MRLRSRHYLRDDTKKRLINEIRSAFGIDVERSSTCQKFEIVEADDEYDIVLIDGEPAFFMTTVSKQDGKIFPTVRGALKFGPKRNLVVVDIGAVRAISNGADIMCPGIVEADTRIQKGDIVIVVDEVHGKPLAIGRALISGEEMMGIRGKAIKSIHYVGDKIWKLEI